MEFHGIPWNSMEAPWSSMEAPWSSMEAPWNSMEFHGSSMEFHGVPWKPQGLSWSSMEAPWKPMESIEVSWNIGGVPWKLTEFHCVTHNSELSPLIIIQNDNSVSFMCEDIYWRYSCLSVTSEDSQTGKIRDWVTFLAVRGFFKLLYQLIIFCTELQAVQFGK